MLWVSGHMAKTICSSRYIVLVTWPIQPVAFA